MVVQKGWSEFLYRTPSGRFFLFGKGSEGSRWWRITPTGCEGAIKPISDDEARVWVEKYCHGDVYECLWPDEVEDA